MTILPRRPSFAPRLLLSLLAIASAGAACAQEGGTHSVRVARIDLHPQTPAAARAVLARLDRAALEACGASGFSLPEMQEATRASDCWRTAMADAVQRAGSPILARAFDDRAARR